MKYNLVRFLTKPQRKQLADFFTTIAAAWFIGLFVAPRITSEFDIFTIMRYILNCLMMLLLALVMVREDI